jgi:hypothetical protein
MLAETHTFFEAVVKDNLKVQSFIDSDWTMLNERLARHYGIAGVNGDSIRRVKLSPSHHRGGVLTHASVLKATANGTTTSPVVRGIFVLENFFGIKPSPPPPGVPGVEPDIRGTSTLRQQLSKHRSLESCNSCHRIIDPPGFALENYDVVGGWRDNYRSLSKDFPAPSADIKAGIRNVKWRVGPPVDATGVTRQGKSFRDIDGFKNILLADPRFFVRAMVEKVAVYVTGRTMSFSDRAELERLTDSVTAKGNGFRDLIHEVVQSNLVRNK